MRILIKQHPGTGLWVSSDGRVILPPCPQIHRFKHTLTYGCKNKKGYMVVTFRGRTYQVHRLIAETFLDNPNGYPTVDHKNRIKTANFVENLRFASYKTQADNTQRVDDSLAKYGVRMCEDKKAYNKAYNAVYKAMHHEEIKAYNKAYNAVYQATHHEEIKDKNAVYYAKQKELGKHYRRCPDGKRRMLTDSEFSAMFG